MPVIGRRKEGRRNPSFFTIIPMTMRTRHKINAVCSSENYSASRRLHKEYLKEKHDSFSMMAVSTPSEKQATRNDNPLKRFIPDYVTIRVFGKPMRVTRSQYEEHCQGFAIIG